MGLCLCSCLEEASDLSLRFWRAQPLRSRDVARNLFQMEWQPDFGWVLCDSRKFVARAQSDINPRPVQGETEASFPDPGTIT